MAEKHFHLYPWLPPYSDAEWVIKILDKKSCQKVNAMKNAIAEHKGDPQKPSNWTEPSVWIRERLDGENQDLALELWEGSDNKVNPRYFHESLGFALPNGLLSREQGIYCKTVRGDKFLKQDLKIIQEIDHNEGVDSLLILVKKNPSLKASKLLPHWVEFLRDVGSKIKSYNAANFSLRRRLNTLHDRNLISKKNALYEITNMGKIYLKSVSTDSVVKISNTDENRNKTNNQIKECNKIVLDEVHKKLSSMDPRDFEFFIKELLLDTGSYEEVDVTPATNDRGVDLKTKHKIQIGEMELFTIEEVIQVKRWKNDVQTTHIRDFVSAMVQSHSSYGTFITLGNFASGVYKIVEEVKKEKKIALINGSKLLDMIQEHSKIFNRHNLECLIEIKEDDWGIKEESESDINQEDL